MKYFFSFSWLLKHYQEAFSENTNWNKTEDSKGFKYYWQLLHLISYDFYILKAYVSQNNPVNRLYFYLPFIYFEVWNVIWIDSATNIFLWSRVLQPFCHEVEAANAILSIAKNNWKENFSDFIDLQGKK